MLHKIPTSAEIKEFVKQKTGHDVEMLGPDPIIAGHVSLIELGVLGHIIIVKDSSGKLWGTPAPFGLSREVP